MKVQRPACRYHGGKWMVAEKIIAVFPPHRIYVELYGGGGSVLLRKPRAHMEIYNDLASEMVNLFQVYRDRGEELRRRVELTPFARDEFEQSYIPHEDALEQARRTLVRSYMGHGSDSLWRRSGFRAKSIRSSTPAPSDWANLPGKMPALIARLRGVVLENRPALELVHRFDGEETLFYADPPYLPETRSSLRDHGHGHSYLHEMSIADHEELARALRAIRGAAVVSGYGSGLYENLYAGWATVRFAGAQSNNPQEVLWINREARTLFD